MPLACGGKSAVTKGLGRVFRRFPPVALLLYRPVPKKLSGEKLAADSAPQGIFAGVVPFMRRLNSVCVIIYNRQVWGTALPEMLAKASGVY